jgi:hypothetical protein
MSNPSVPHARILYDQAKQAWQYEVFFPGRPPHDRHPLFSTPEDAILVVDPQRERIWTIISEGLNRVWESTAYVPGSVMDRMARWRSPLRR